MLYKDFELSLSGVYSLVNGVKKYSLIIKKDNNVVYESSHEYENEKIAFSFGKKLLDSIINSNNDLLSLSQFDFEKLEYELKANNKSVNSYNKAKDKIKKCDVVNGILLLLILVINIVLIVNLFISDIDYNIMFISMLGCCMSIIFVFVSYLNGFIYPENGTTLSKKSKNVLNLAWWIQLFFGNGPVPSVELLDDNKLYYKNWNPSSSILFICFEMFLGVFNIFINKLFSILYITKIVLWIIIIIYSFIWKRTIKFIKNQDEGFGYIRR